MDQLSLAAKREEILVIKTRTRTELLLLSYYFFSEIRRVNFNIINLLKLII